MYRILLHPAIEKSISRIPRPLAERLAQAMRGLRTNPHPLQSKPLGQNLFRLRVGEYRIVYAVIPEEKVFFIAKVARRSEKTYRNLAGLLASARKATVPFKPTTLQGSRPTSPKKKKTKKG